MASNRVSLVLAHVYLNDIANASLRSSTTPYAVLKEALSHDQGKLDSALGDAKAAPEVESWTNQAASASAADTNSFDTFKGALEKHLTNKTYIAADRVTAADIAAYTALYPHVSTANHSTLLTHPCITRHFDLIQHLPLVRGSLFDSSSPSIVKEAFKNGPVAIEVENVPVFKRNIEATKKDKKKKEGAETAAAPENAAVPAADNKKEKKEKKAKEAKPKAPAAPAAPPMPHMIDIRVGKILEVSKHPDADALYVEKVDLGEAEPRTIVSGLVKYVPMESMVNLSVVAICNLKPFAFRGIKSYGMLLCATHKDGKDAGIEIVRPPEGSKPGDRIYFEGFENEAPLPELNPKKKIFETIQPGFITLDDRSTAWIDPANKDAAKPVAIRTEKGPCHAPSFVGASLS